MNTQFHFEILAKSSSGDPYRVVFDINDNDITALCSCPAGTHKVLCKHIIRLLSGDHSMLYDNNQQKSLEDICLHIEKTPIPSIVSELAESEILLEKAQKEVKNGKNKLSKHIRYK